MFRSQNGVDKWGLARKEEYQPAGQQMIGASSALRLLSEGKSQREATLSTFSGAPGSDTRLWQCPAGALPWSRQPDCGS